MRLTILGCNGPYPEPGGACSGYLIESDSGRTRIVLELGCGTLPRLMNYTDPTKIDALILSHLHFDHISDVPVLGYLLDFSDIDTLKLICPETPAENRRLFKGKFDVYPPQDTQIGEFKIQFMRVKHPVETYAVKIFGDDSVFIYTGDTNECPEIELFASGADTILADCGLSSADWRPGKPHLSPEKCAALAKASGASLLILSHLSPKYDKQELFDESAQIFPNTELAEEGMQIRI